MSEILEMFFFFSDFRQEPHRTSVQQVAEADWRSRRGVRVAWLVEQRETNSLHLHQAQYPFLSLLKNSILVCDLNCCTLKASLKDTYLTKKIKKRVEDDGIFCSCSLSPDSSSSSSVCGSNCHCGYVWLSFLNYVKSIYKHGLSIFNLCALGCYSRAVLPVASVGLSVRISRSSTVMSRSWSWFR